ncbi:MAG: membrane integrity-associated transporter subunit PqiC [Comamonadaceae bacterium]|nr:MAG: membrane integrity-associated transporter subunit PqiC [Comamonadaceae bacterium]
MTFQVVGQHAHRRRGARQLLHRLAQVLLQRCVFGQRAAATPLAIEFAPVAVPERLARPQMVLRRAGEGSAEVRVLEQHRWASSFEQELRDALSSGVAARLGVPDVTRGGRAQGQSVWRVSVQLQSFDAVEDGDVQARLQWRLRRPDGSDAGACNWAASESAGAGIDALAQGAQRLTARAAQAIATQIAGLQAGGMLRCDA